MKCFEKITTVLFLSNEKFSCSLALQHPFCYFTSQCLLIWGTLPTLVRLEWLITLQDLPYELQIIDRVNYLSGEWIIHQVDNRKFKQFLDQVNLPNISFRPMTSYWPHRNTWSVEFLRRQSWACSCPSDTESTSQSDQLLQDCFHFRQICFLPLLCLQTLPTAFPVRYSKFHHSSKTKWHFNLQNKI